MSSGAHVDQAVSMLELQVSSAFQHGVDLQARTVLLTGEVNDKMFKKVDAALNILEQLGRKAITIRINSEGGNPYDALAIVGRMQVSSCNINVDAFGLCASAATIVLAAGKKRRMSRVAFFMHHDGNAVMEGNQEQLEAAIAQNAKEHEAWCEFMAAHSNETAEYWKQIGRHKDAYLNAEELKDLGVIDGIF